MVIGSDKDIDIGEIDNNGDIDNSDDIDSD